ncbi:MAG: hypothetical protein IH991_03775, partial [Planctomycetes bacterium]|nr:hypothetical protein [Planctomycetota bacterium]
MNAIPQATRNWLVGVRQGWERFWFTPAQPHTLALIRIFAGTMLFYTHLVWSLDLMSFLGPDAWITSDVSQKITPAIFNWSYLYYVDSPGLLWTLHIGALVVFAMLTVGLFTRVVSILAFLLVITFFTTGRVFTTIVALPALFFGAGSSVGIEGAFPPLKAFSASWPNGTTSFTTSGFLPVEGLKVGR